MDDVRLAAGISAWLHENDITPPDARMSAGRVMAGVEQAEQLGRWWPPASRVPRVRPVPALGAPRESAPPPALAPEAGSTAARVRSMLTPLRLGAVVIVILLIGGALLVLPGLLPQPSETAATASSSPQPSAAPAQEPSPSPTPAPTPSPTSTPRDSSAESRFAATRVLLTLDPGADPASLGMGASRTAVFVDRAAGEVYEVRDDGVPRTIAGPGSLAGDEPIGSPVLAARGGRDIVIVDDEGLGWRSIESSRPGVLQPLFAIDPATRALTTTTRARREYDVYVAEPASGDIVRYSLRLPGEEIQEQDDRTLRAGRPQVLDLYVDQHRYVLTAAGLERYVKGELDEGFALQALPQGDPDYRFVDGIGRAGKGQLWLYDAAGGQVVAFDKGDGSYLGSWGPGADEPAMTDVRGMYVAGDGSGTASTVIWLTSGGLMQSELTDPSGAPAASETAAP